jgi:radical SAM superfamily enzyme YgiQ (UPF0313 family)
MKKTILMIYPETPAAYWSFKHILKIVGRRAAFPPLGLMTVAALVPDRYEVRLVDMNVTSLKAEDILGADFVFISAMIIQKDSFEQAVACCKDLGNTVVAGGPYPTSSYEKITGVDHFILGEAETVMSQFFIDFEKGNPQKVYQCTKKPDMSSSPVPRFDLIKQRNYTTMSLQYSRGCPFNCEFCDIIEMFGRVPRAKGPVQFVGEMDALYKTGYRGPLFIVDDNFIGNKRNVKKLLPAISAWQKERRYPYMIFTEASVDLADDEELMDMMIDAGFNKVFLGIETPVQESLILSQKRQNVRIELKDGIEKIQRKGMEVTAGFILGFDSDPADVFDIQVDFINRSGIPMAMVGLLTALPNTQLYRRLESEDRITKETSGNNTNAFEVNFKPVMGIENLVNGYKKVISRIYDPGAYFSRCLVMMKRMPRGRFYAGAATPRMMLYVVRIFLLSFIRQVCSFYGNRYLKFLAKALSISPGCFPKAIKMALFGHHFYKITRGILAADDFSASIEKLRIGLRTRIEKIRVEKIEDVMRDLFSLDAALLERRFIIKAQKKYAALQQDFSKIIEEQMKRLGDEFKAYIEMMLQSLRKRFESGTTQESAVKELKLRLKEIKNRLKRRYRYLNGDFQAYFHGLFNFFNARIDNLIREFESRCEAGK